MSKTANWAIQRVLNFLNSAQDAAAITQSPLLRDADGEGYVLGTTVASRIIETRQGLRARRFRSLDEVKAIAGLGPDKLNDLLSSLAIPADRYFIQLLFDGILLENWQVTPLSREFRSSEELAQITDTVDGMRRIAAELVSGDYSPFGDRNQRYQHLAIRNSFAERYESNHLGAFQFAYWWYLFDQDNWFSYDRIKTACEEYLAYHNAQEDRLELWLLKGFNQLAEEEMGYANILPVIVNHGERKITVWQVQLLD